MTAEGWVVMDHSSPLLAASIGKGVEILLIYSVTQVVWHKVLLT